MRCIYNNKKCLYEVFSLLYEFYKRFHGWLGSMPILWVPGIFVESSHYAKHAVPKEGAEY